ncbi:MAG: SRPBCC family protein [Caldilineaceae bacterium]|nr:SRPBCC family protein [Caldilineaceae bacterium]HRJ44334.1 SRPBCC family protein [Caldilineaceae bacterium]
MAINRINASAVIPAPADRVYGIIADYRDGHPHILPKPYFLSLEVVEGGVGAGTVVAFSMRLMGRVQHFRATVSEPEPGRVLVETNDSGAVTSFVVDPRPGNQCQVTIVTETDVRDGIAGKIAGWLTNRLLHPIYVKELAQLAAFAQVSPEK